MIESITIVVSGLGAVLVIILFLEVRLANTQIKLNRHRSKNAGVSDLLNYAAVVDDGVIVGKNGSFLAAWLYKGDDNSSSTEEQREMVSLRLNQALAGLGNGWMIHVDAVRRPGPLLSLKEYCHESFELSLSPLNYKTAFPLAFQPLFLIFPNILQ